jgi:Putative zinc-finger
MQHLTIECLIGFAEGRLSPETKLQVEQHLARCSACFAGMSEWFLLSDLLKVTNLETTPQYPIRNSIALHDITKPVSNFKELFATGFFDSTAAARADIRSIEDCQQILFRAGDVDVQLRISGNPRVIQGQMIRRKASYFLVGVPVGLSQNEREIQATITDMRGEFRFATVPSGTFRLHADLPSYRLVGDFTIKEEEIN